MAFFPYCCPLPILGSTVLLEPPRVLCPCASLLGSPHPLGASKEQRLPNWFRLNSHQSSLQLQGSTLGSEQKPCTVQIFALQLEKEGRKGAVGSLHQPLGMQSPADSSMRPSPGEIQTLAGAEADVPVGEGGGCHRQGRAV